MNMPVPFIRERRPIISPLPARRFAKAKECSSQKGLISKNHGYHPHYLAY
jgi:hypothetical protein